MGDKLDVYVKEIENTYFLIGKVEMTPIFSLKITQILENFLKILDKLLEYLVIHPYFHFFLSLIN